MIPPVPAALRQLNIASICGLVSPGRSAYTAPSEPWIVTGSANCSGLRVTMLTEPAVPPSTSFACEVLCTTTRSTISDGYSE